MAATVPRGSAERPLQNVVLCFTSVAPEQRTRYAGLAQQMGAEHKLDLTSDTTHLIVGSTDTPKYKYVAKEREDIKVLRPEWIEAVRECWINDRPLDLESLDKEHRVPTMAGLKICITGFEDLSFRAQLQKNVVENGGEYTGDLTKDVSHLIAAKPEGKKYEYGMQWQKKVVGLKWYKDTLERGMQLDESLYHPTIPVSDQGAGAWNRKSRHSPPVSKRPLEDNSIAEPARKLRRTVSARLGSQNDTMWTDIVGGSGFDSVRPPRRELKNATSMPTLVRASELAGVTQGKGTGEVSEALQAPRDNVKDGFLKGFSFTIHGFDAKRENVVYRILQENGATITSADDENEPEQGRRRLFLLPYDMGKKDAFTRKKLADQATLVSELWLERCMIEKKFINPQQYPLGEVTCRPAIEGFRDLTINATGFGPLETLHISKMVTMFGGIYDQVFTSNVSILLWRSGSSNPTKLSLAQHSAVPVVTESWLWTTIRTCRKVNFQPYLVQPITLTERKREDGTTKERTADRNNSDYVEVSTIPLKQGPPDQRRKDRNVRRSGDNSRTPGLAEKRPLENSWIHVDNDPTTDPSRAIEHQSAEAKATSLNSVDDETQDASFVMVEPALKELDPNSPGKQPSESGRKDATLQPYDGNCSVQESFHHVDALANHPEQGTASSVQAINGAIRELLEQQTRKKHSDTRTKEATASKGRLIGRALSNLSTTSMTSQPRVSRAGSIESVNTDGVGSEIASLQSSRMANDVPPLLAKGKIGLTGRAKSTLTGLKPSSFGLDDPDLDRGHFQAEEEDTLQMTQLGYEDPEEAIILREKLAQTRRKRSNLGQKGEDSKPAAQQRNERKIRDDEVLMNAGWGVGRRTRNKPRSPSGQEISKF